MLKHGIDSTLIQHSTLLFQLGPISVTTTNSTTSATTTATTTTGGNNTNCITNGIYFSETHNLFIYALFNRLGWNKVEAAITVTWPCAETEETHLLCMKSFDPLPIIKQLLRSRTSWNIIEFFTLNKQRREAFFLRPLMNRVHCRHVPNELFRCLCKLFQGNHQLDIFYIYILSTPSAVLLIKWPDPNRQCSSQV